MSVVAFLSDVHVGNHRGFGGEMHSGVNDRCRLVLDTLHRALSVAEAVAVDAVVILGDLLDSPKPTPQVLGATMATLIPAGSAALLLGNHEITSFDANDHALFPFESHDVYDVPEIHFAGGVLIPHREATIEWIRAGFDAALVDAHHSDSELHIKWVGIHAGISDVDTPDFLEGIPATDLLKFAEKEQVRVFAGDWHNSQTWGGSLQNEKRRSVVQCGALCPTGFDNPGLDYGYVWFYDTKDDFVWNEIIPGPRFFSHDFEKLDLKKLKRALRTVAEDTEGYTFFIKLRAKPDQLSDAMSCARKMRAWKNVGGVRVEPDGEALHRKARSAAAAARSGETLEESLQEYLRFLDIPKGVSRKRVGERVRRYLGI